MKLLSPRRVSMAAAGITVTTTTIAAVWLAAAGPLARPVRADPPAEIVRTLAGKYKSSVVTLAVVIKMTAPGAGEGETTEMEVDGFLLDGSGLVATTNMAIDPASMYAAAMGDEGGAAGISSKVVSIRILTPDGQEMPAKVVLRDTDRNLAFIRPIQSPATPMTAVDFKTPGTAQIGDPVFIMGRLGKTGNRATEIKMGRVISVIERPRTLT
jgi:S1-C subfamily serine protease